MNPSASLALWNLTEDYESLSPPVPCDPTSPHWSESDREFMRLAIRLATEAAEAGEVPVGAVLVRDGIPIGKGQNAPIALHDPTLHAEIAALRQAALQARNYRLPGSTLYVTIEPCVMCAGAIVAARVERLVFGARDLRFGAVRSKFALVDSDLLNHRVRVEEGLFASEAAELLARFFRELRVEHQLDMQ